MLVHKCFRGRRGGDRMVVGFTTTYVISVYHYWCCEFESRSVQCNKVCQWLATGRWFSSGPTVSSTNKTDCHDITEILLKVALNTIKQANKPLVFLSPNNYTEAWFQGYLSLSTQIFTGRIVEVCLWRWKKISLITQELSLSTL